MQDIVLLSKTDEWSKQAGDTAKIVFGPRLSIVSGKIGSPFPEDVAWLKPKWLISFLSPWIVPSRVLGVCEKAINFHPASSDYPGTGCYNFALYENARAYGALSHFMAEKVDTGAIIEERRFPVFEHETVETLKHRTMVVMLALFHDIACRIARGEPLQPSAVIWGRKPFTRRQLNELTTVTTDMSADEVRRRIRSTTYPGYPGPCAVIGGERFFYPVPNRKPLA